VGWWQLQLNDYSLEPKPPVKFSEVKMKEIGNILETSESLLRLNN